MKWLHQTSYRMFPSAQKDTSCPFRLIYLTCVPLLTLFYPRSNHFLTLPYIVLPAFGRYINRFRDVCTLLCLSFVVQQSIFRSIHVVHISSYLPCLCLAVFHCDYTAIFQSISLSINIYIVYNFELLWTKLIYKMFVYKTDVFISLIFM